MDNAWLLETDGTQKEVKPKNGTDFSLREVYELLECEMVQAHRTPQPDMMLLMDEEGKMKDVDINVQASRLVKPYLLTGDFIVGKALYLPRRMFK